ncbi:MAG: hypothetical protein O3C34_05720 [Proteobacteria bacterium]|nr:hypothetical protein [Pseudomonadota bacterium]
MRAFEIHTYQDGKWRMDSVFDDRELALFEARRVDEGSRYSGVRVIEENYDETSDKTTTRTIFRGGNLDRQRKVSLAKKAFRTPRRGSSTREPRKNRRSKKIPKKSNPLIPILILGVLAVAGLAALYGLQQLSQFR